MTTDHVTLIEVGPRDGLQSEKEIIATSIKIALIEQLAAAGCSVIESTSFTSAKWIPQLADNTAVMQGIQRRAGVRYPVLIPNVIGLQNAIKAGVNDIAVFTAASETFNKKNINASIAESLVRITPVIHLAKQHALPVRAYISCVWGCPYEDQISIEQVVTVAEKLMDLGVDEISLGDTIGIASPKQTREMLQALQTVIPIAQTAVHFHDTYGQALANILTALELGIRRIDSAVAGLGGCPYAEGASGNVASEDVVYLLHGLGMSTGIDLMALAQAGEFICQHLRQDTRSKVARALLAKGRNAA